MDLEDFDDKFQVSQFLIFAFVSLFSVLTVVLSYQFNGIEATNQILYENRVILVFLGLLITAIIPVYSEAHDRFSRIMRQGGFSFVLITLGSFIIWVHRFYIDPSNLTATQELIYTFGSRIWYISGIGLVISGALGIDYDAND